MFFLDVSHERFLQSDIVREEHFVTDCEKNSQKSIRTVRPVLRRSGMCPAPSPHKVQNRDPEEAVAKAVAHFFIRCDKTKK